MATEGKQVTDFPNFDWNDWKGTNEREDAFWKKAKVDGRRFVRFPMADGYAVYEVKGVKRYTLHHVPEGDSWEVNPALIRGLRKEDIDEMVNRDKRMG